MKHASRLILAAVLSLALISGIENTRHKRAIVIFLSTDLMIILFKDEGLDLFFQGHDVGNHGLDVFCFQCGVGCHWYGAPDATASADDLLY